METTEHRLTGFEKAIAKDFGMVNLGANRHVIRDEKGWRTNERIIRHSWIVLVARSFVGWGGIFRIQYEASAFREIYNPEEVVTGIFIEGKDATINNLNYQRLEPDYPNPFNQLKFELLNASENLTLDGVTYEMLINGKNIRSTIALNNPDSEHWETWEASILEYGYQLARHFQNDHLTNLFSI